MRLPILILLTSLAHAEEIPSNKDLRPIDEWAKKIDRTKPIMRPATHQTSFGNPVDHHSCTENGKIEDRIRALDFGIAYAMTQSQVCSKLFGFGELTSLVGLLRKVRFSCFYDKGSDFINVANNFPNSLRHKDEHSSFRHDYRIEYIVKMLDSEEDDSTGPTLFHEALHNTKANNRSWHDDIKGRNISGKKDSLFEDRIYLMSAACFPYSIEGSYFYGTNGAAFHPEICEKALTEVDPEAISRYTRLGSQSLSGGSYKKQDAKTICSRVEKFAKIFRQQNQEFQALQTRRKRFAAVFKNEKLDEFFRTALKAYYSTTNQSELKEKLNGLHQKLGTELEKGTSPAIKKQI